MSNNNAFITRHLGPSPAQRQEMLKTVGAKSLEDLAAQIIPSTLPRYKPAEDTPALSEEETRRKLQDFSSKNRPGHSFIGMGYTSAIMPAPVRRHLLENAGWYTAYTPYQAEISQGRLELLLTFQQLTIDLTGLPLAGASLLDEATAAAEAMSMTKRHTKSSSNIFAVDEDTHPQTIAVVKTRAQAIGIKVEVAPVSKLDGIDSYATLISYPSSSGCVADLSGAIAKIKANNSQVILASDPLSLVLLKPPAEMGADVAIGTFQSFGLPLGFGGPHPAYIASSEQYRRQLPGRIIGVSHDSEGRQAVRMALQTREQHIKRERAASNICTAQALPAMLATAYAIYHGPEGLKEIASEIHSYATRFAQAAEAKGYQLVNEQFFSTVALKIDAKQMDAKQAETLANKAESNDLLLNLDKAKGLLSVTFDEVTDEETFRKLCEVFSLELPADNAKSKSSIASSISGAMLRKDTILADRRFHQFRNETAFMRYLRSLQDKDLALDRSMIPLGSCTMKLNPTTSMESLSLTGLANLHPLAPESRCQGYAEMIQDLNEKLQDHTGFDEISFQPNSGAQGEFAGLLAIKSYHESRKDTARNICLIPTSAHGTNPASATMVGMKVVAVACDPKGNIDTQDLKEKLEQHGNNVAALMVTYPSTHGVFEKEIVNICSEVHKKGGQIYFDGANMNAMAGLVRPGDLGADVGHLNLHKTYAIPHGGGGPGMGPIGVKKHLIPFLPSNPNGAGNNAVSAANYSSALILAISWSYIAMLGLDGVRQATTNAILNANYIAQKLKKDFPLVYSGPENRVAHECILDCREFIKSAGIQVEDIAKRLIDYGFHAPTMSWPVAGCLMIEPTESEDKTEMDRFIDAMREIRKEIKAVEDNALPRDNNPLVMAPHTMETICADKWDRPYSRSTAAVTVDGSVVRYRAPVSRIDQVYGDRNLFCSCESLDWKEDNPEQ